MNLSIFSLALRRSAGGSLDAQTHVLAIRSRVLGHILQQALHGNMVLPEELSRTSREEFSSLKASWMHSFSSILHFSFAHFVNSSHVPHNCTALRIGLRPCVVLHRLSASSFSVLGLARADGHGLVRTCRHFPLPCAGMHCEGGCNICIARCSHLATSCSRPFCTTRKARWNGAYLPHARYLGAFCLVPFCRWKLSSKCSFHRSDGPHHFWWPLCRFCWVQLLPSLFFPVRVACCF